MSDAFDPYHKWLGIPPNEQPPNHYRLLGVGLFEPDGDVIDAAANQRMSYLQDMATGPHVDDSQRLLNEIASARLCLLQPDTRSTYDSQLQEQIGAAESTEPEPAAAPAATGLPLTTLISIASLAVVTLVIGLAVVFRGGGGGADDPSRFATVKIVWKLDEREGAYLLVDQSIMFDSENKFPPKNETLVYKLKPGSHRFRLERKGFRVIQFSDKYIGGETQTVKQLNWKPQ